MRKTILLVEDNADSEYLMLRALEKNRIACELIVARDGAAALDYLFGTGAFAGRDSSLVPQVIFLDLNLPKIDGLEVLRGLRADKRTKLIPVVILTTSAEQEEIIRGYQLGANNYVQKVTDFDDFVETVRHLGTNWLNLNQTVSDP